MRKLIKFLSLILAVWLIAGSLVFLISCNGNDGDEDGDGEFNPYPYDDLSVFMDVPDYKNITLSESLVSRLVNTELAYFYRENGIDTEVAHEGAKEWDMVEISFTGYIDGVPDEALCSESYLLALGSDTFYVDGFENGIIGMSAGQSKTLSLKFASDYPSELYAGKDVSYSVTVNRIYRAPTLTDALCAEHTAFDTAGQYLKFVRERCIFLYVWDDLMTKCVIKSYPTEYTEYYQDFKGNFQLLAEQNGLSFAEFISTNGDKYAEFGLYSGMNQMDFEEVATNYAKSNLVNDLLTYSIVRAEGIKTEGAEFDEAVKLVEREQGMTYEALVLSKGESAAIITVLSVRLCQVINGYVKIESN